jgi:hypothetical protein
MMRLEIPGRSGKKPERRMTMKFMSLVLIGVLTWGAALPATAGFIGQNNSEVQAVANPILDGILQGFKKGDYGLYSQNFDDTLKDVISKKKFMQTRNQILKSIGAYESRSYLGYLQKGKTTMVLWKGKFSNSADDVLIKLVLSRRGDQTKVLGLWFQ